MKLQTGEFRWDSHEQGVILSSFYYGYSVTLLVSGCVPLRRLSGMCPLLCGLLVTCIMTLVTPVVTMLGDVVALVVASVVAGIGQVACLMAFQ